jgi:DnaD/phage-associated family protein
VSFKIEDSANYFLDDTLVPNLFIAEYMPDAPGDFVKIYLYAYMCVQQSKALTNELIADKLDVKADIIFSAWQYFEDRRMIKKHHLEPRDGRHFDVEFMDIKSRLFSRTAADISSSGEASPHSRHLENEAIKNMWAKISEITGEVALSGNDMKKITELLTEDAATPEVIIAAYEYARDGKKSMRVTTLAKRIVAWTEKGLKTKDDVSAFLAETDARYAAYREIMKALGLGYSSLADAEKREFNKWFDEYGYSLEDILARCDKAAGKNNKYPYVRGIIEKEVKQGIKGKDSGVSAMAARQEHYQKLREKTEQEATARTEEVYAALPEVKKLDDEISYKNFERVKLVTSNIADKEAAVASIDKALTTLLAKKTKLLTGAGFTQD